MDKSNKEIAISFLSLASSGKVHEAYEKYVHPHFRHHNPYFKGDRESLLKGMEESAVRFPQKRFEGKPSHTCAWKPMHTTCVRSRISNRRFRIARTMFPGQNGRSAGSSNWPAYPVHRFGW